MRFLMLVVVLVGSLPAFAQKEELFGNGKPVVFREEMMDKRFAKSRVGKMLVSGTDEPGCVQLLGGLFIVLGEMAPLMHKKDENFFLDPVLVDAVNQQLSTPSFPAMAYLLSMVRRIMIDKRMPDEWFELAKQLNTRVKIIDVAKLKMLNDGVNLIDSAYYQIPVLKNRYITEVAAANSAVTTDVVASFRDTYLDRDVAWGGAILLDAGLNTPKKGKKKPKPGELTELVAILEWVPPDPRKKELDLYGKNTEPPPPIRIIAKLASKQYIDLEKVARGQRMMIKGRFWEMNRSVNEVEVRDALLFDDRDWSNGAVLGSPQDISTCSAAVNELTGVRPQQPGGFGH